MMASHFFFLTFVNFDVSNNSCHRSSLWPFETDALMKRDRIVSKQASTVTV